jgi:hypothetical protein
MQRLTGPASVLFKALSVTSGDGDQVTVNPRTLREAVHATGLAHLRPHDRHLRRIAVQTIKALGLSPRAFGSLRRAERVLRLFQSQLG